MNRQVAVFVYCDQDGFVDAIEFGTPGYGESTGDRVLYESIDLFATPVDAVVAVLREHNLRVDVTEGGYSHTVPELLLAFWRDGGPRDTRDMPLFFESVLMAAPGYYDD